MKQIHDKESIGENSKRAFTFTYSLKTEDGFVYPVCKQMFLNTMGLGERSVLSWVKKCDGHGISPSSENILSERKVQNHRIVKKSQSKEILEKFLDDMPKLTSHYCRQSINKKYIEPIYGNNMVDVYIEYKRLCLEDVDKPIPVSRFTFDQMITKQNLAFH